MSADSLDQLAINTIRTLTIDAVQQARSGHPGAPITKPVDFPNYAAGSTGPAAADALLARDGRAWRPLD